MLALCSPRTMCRLLAAAHEVRERRNQLPHVAPRPELLATPPNEVWSWDITKLLGPAKWTYYYLYVIIDIFSRYVVGWMVAHAESARLAERLIAETCETQEIGDDVVAGSGHYLFRSYLPTRVALWFLLNDARVYRAISVSKRRGAELGHSRARAAVRSSFRWTALMRVTPATMESVYVGRVRPAA